MKFKKTILISIIIISISMVAYSSDVYTKIGKAFDIFSSIVRLISNNYVLDIDEEILINNAIDGMLSSLDQYTEYYTENDNETLEFLSNASYVGLGISVYSIDSMITITSVSDGNPADIAGLKVGDIIYKVNDNIVINLDTDSLRFFTKKNEQELDITVIRENGDTITKRIKNQKITIENIGFSEIIQDSIAYVKLDRFSKTTASELRDVLQDLDKKKELKGLIIDVRNNPGGLLEASVQVLELFLPYKSLATTTKSTHTKLEHSYYTENQPKYPNLPICIIINENTASAAEILAGAIQDYDRGIIVGKKSFGKGLVQSIFDVPYNGSLKMTTSKYYTPSGRCIQKLDFAEKYHSKIVLNSKDTTVFTTQNGRKVYELNGIQPDSTIELYIDNEYYIDILGNSLFHKFAKYYTQKNKNVNIDKINNNQLFDEFINYIKDYNIKPFSKVFSSIDNITQELKNNKYVIKSNKIVSELKSNLKKEFIDELKRDKEQITLQLKFDIMQRYNSEKNVLKYYYSNDPLLRKISNLLISSEYKKILEPK